MTATKPAAAPTGIVVATGLKAGPTPKTKQTLVLQSS